jgi:hypothetical protein
VSDGSQKRKCSRTKPPHFPRDHGVGCFLPDSPPLQNPGLARYRYNAYLPSKNQVASSAIITCLPRALPMTANLSDLEQRAVRATSFPAFPINLPQIRDTVSSLLKEVGRYGFFDEYTDHSFEHVVGMLSTAEWIIPDETKKCLTPADYLFIVLAIYFHDVGLLISRDEYDKRHGNKEYQRFKNNLPLSQSHHIQLQISLDR